MLVFLARLGESLKQKVFRLKQNRFKVVPKKHVFLQASKQAREQASKSMEEQAGASKSRQKQTKTNKNMHKQAQASTRKHKQAQASKQAGSQAGRQSQKVLFEIYFFEPDGHTPGRMGFHRIRKHVFLRPKHVF